MTYRVVGEGDVADLRALLACGADVDAEDDAGSTALHFAAEFGREEAVQLLVESGADLEARDDTGQSALVGTRARAFFLCSGHCRVRRARAVRCTHSGTVGTHRSDQG
jgi:hypothetical protein|eukprot:COSAG03_NODE_28_length_18724_cov_10.718128_2_plen_108_part_00